MRILVVTQYFWPENFRINDLVTELKKRGHELTVLTGKPNYPSGIVFEEYQRNPVQFLDYLGVDVFRVPMLARSTGSLRLVLNYISFAISASLFGAWKLRKKAFDVVFIYEPSPITVALPAILIGKLRKVPVVFWVLDLWPETLYAVGAVRSQRVLGSVGRLVRFIYDRCTLVLGQSRSFIPSIAKYCSDESKIRYYPSWAEDAFVDLDVQKAPEVTIADNCFNVVFAGNIGKSQDMPALIDAAYILRDKQNLRWLIVGDGRQFEWLKGEVQRRGLGRRVILLGRYPIERMPSFYSHASALLVSLRKDSVFSKTIPAKLQTYLMFGKPVLGMLDGEGAKVIHDAHAGLACPAGDSNALADCVSKMMQMSGNELDDMGKSGRQYAQNEFDRIELISKLEALLQEAVDIQQAKI